MKRKKIIFIIGIIILIALIIGISFAVIRSTENNKAKKDIKIIAERFYEETYFQTMNKEILNDFTEKGINISLSELLDIEEEDSAMYKKYNLNKSKIIIYPEKPYTKNSYKVEIKLYRK